MVSRLVQRAALRLADQQSERIKSTTGSDRFYADVTAVSPGAARDGNALVTVTWRGEPVVVASYGSTYTPAVGHRVLCLITENQVSIIDRQVGFP